MNALRVGDIACPTPHVRFPTRKRQDCQDSRDSLVTVHSEKYISKEINK